MMVMNAAIRFRGMGRGDAVRREDGWGDGYERSSSGELDSMGRGKGAELDSRTR